MARIFRNLFFTLITITIATSLIASSEVTAQDKEKKDEKKDGKDKKDPKDHKDIKKEPFKVDTPAKAFTYLAKDKDTDKGKTSWVYAVAFADDGKNVVATYRPHTVVVWDVVAKNEAIIHVLPSVRGQGDLKCLVTRSSVGVLIGSGQLNALDSKKPLPKDAPIRAGKIYVWGFGGKKPDMAKPMIGHGDDVECLALSGDGSILASGSKDSTIKIWKLKEDKAIQTLKGHTDDVTSVAFSPDGKQLVSTSKDKTVRVWDVDGAKETASFKVKTEVEKKDAKGKVTKTKELGREFTNAVFTKDGKQVIAVNLDGLIKVYDVNGKNEVKELKAHDGIWALALNADRSKFATAGYDGTIKLWKADDFTELRTIKAHLRPGTTEEAGTVTSLSFSRDGQWLASGGIDGTVKVWAVK